MSAIEEKYKDFTREELLSWIEHCEIFFDENLVQDNEFNARFSVYGRLVRYATKKNDELAALREKLKAAEALAEKWQDKNKYVADVVICGEELAAALKSEAQ